MTGPVAAKRITRAATPEDLRDLLEHPPRATLALNDGGSIRAFPVSFRLDSARFLFAPPPSESVEENAEAVLLVDEGCYHTELRGVSVRGAVRAASPAPWLEIVPRKTNAWDYGGMRERL